MKPNTLTSCTSKKRYESKHEAELVAKYVWEKKELEVFPYRCQMCEGFHLTSTKK